MKYLYETGNKDFSIYSSGFVFHSIKGHPPLPVRISSEFFQRAYHELEGFEGKACSIYDPMCGSGATLATLKYLHWGLIDTVIGSDISRESLEIAKLNLGLLTHQGIDKRTAKLERDHQEFGKESHRAALGAAEQLKQKIIDDAATHSFQADATDADQINAGLAGKKIDLVLFDVPYGILSNWAGQSTKKREQEIVALVLNNLYPVVEDGGIATVFLPKKYQVDKNPFRRIKRQKIGKREVWMFKK